MFSIIIPTYNERENIENLVPTIFNILAANRLTAEVIVVDDSSPDGTAEAAGRLSQRFPVRVHQRMAKLGLSSAVLDGFKLSRKDVLCVMDADHSHPPDALPWLYRALQHADVVIGSRHVPGGYIENWPGHRKVISKGAGLLARPVTRVKDPMSGFFMLKRSVIDGVELNPRGYKILLEILAKGKYGKVKEIPIVFRDRRSGQSKLDRKEMWNYFRHVTSLWKHRAKR